jgi:hypothetical protein
MRKLNPAFYIICFGLLAIFSACYSFKGLSIDPSTTTFFIKNFENRAAAAQPALAQSLTERMKSRVRSETRLRINQETPDVEFTGFIADYKVSADAPNATQGSALNRLTIVLHIDYKDNKVEKNNYSQDFQDFEIFPAAKSLTDVQEELDKKITERIFNQIITKTFNNW